MAWWKRLFGRGAGKSAGLTEYHVNSTLYSADGNRAVEVREFSNGETYLLESEMAEDMVFRERYAGRLVGPFPSSDAAEKFIVATPWFNGNASE